MATVKFLTGNKENISTGIENKTITDGSVLITENTDEIAVVRPNEEGQLEANFIKSRTQQAYTLNGTSIGALASGSTIPAGTSIDELLNMIVAKSIPASYRAPSASIARSGGTDSKAWEVGTKVDISVKSTFNKNDAGNLTGNVIYKKTQIGSNAATTVELANEAISPLTASESQVSLPEGTIKVYSTVSYEAGPIKNDNLGKPSPTGSIAKGSKTSSELTWTGQRNAFYGAGSGTLPALNSANIRSLTGKKLNPSNGTSFTINLAKGEKYAIFAYPSNLRDVTTVKYEETNDAGMKTSFTKELVNVGGADATTENIGNYSKEYKVYYFEMNEPAAAGMTFTVTI